MTATEDITFRFFAPIQVRMSDLDPFAHVNNGVQCNYFDYGRSCYFEHVFGEQIDWLSMDMVLVHVDMDFRGPIKVQDQIVCETAIYEFGNKSFKMVQRLKSAVTGQVKTICHSVLSGFDRKTEQSAPIRADYKRKIAEFEHLEL